MNQIASGGSSSRALFSSSPIPKSTPEAHSFEECGSSDETSHAVEWNLPTVLNMCAVAWQTWREPTKGKQYTNGMSGGTTVQYLSERFVRERFSGLLKVHVLQVESKRGNSSQVRVRAWAAFAQLPLSLFLFQQHNF
jgi:hypothetical protein